MSKKKTTIQLRVNYHQVDQMGIVHHAQYAYFLEQARIDWLRNQGVSYADMEEDGILLPLTEISIQYKRPLRFDDLFFVHTKIDVFDNYYVTFDYRIENQEKTTITTATTRLVFVDKKTMRAMKCPAFFREKFTF
ncbi:MAG: Putative esterase [Bacteroidota bacterium]|nr:MAG: Putative esterase [Bacteroidota bacterium]